MVISIVFAGILIFIFCLGLIFDVLGTYAAIKLMIKDKRKLGKLFYYMIYVGEALEKVSIGCIKYGIFIFIVELIFKFK